MGVISADEGRYGVMTLGSFPAWAAMNVMSGGELAQCEGSDDDRFTSDGGPAQTNHVLHLFEFTVPSAPRKLTLCHEGYTLPIGGGGGPMRTSLAVYLWDLGLWSEIGPYHDNAYDTEVTHTYTDADVIDDILNDDGEARVGVIGYHTSTPAVGRLYTDRCWLEVGEGRIATAHNAFGQRFRVFDDGDAGAVSFERRDLASGDWSAATQPFGEGSNTPDIECLADGRLRCALIDSDGNKQQFYSSDDGESWS